MVKSSLRKSIGSLCLNKTQLATFVTETEGILNSRPLIYVDEDINSANAITPNHFLSPMNKVGTPALNGNIEDEDQQDEDFSPRRETSAEVLIRIWKKGQSHLDRLWKLWYGHYVLSLRERYQKSIKGSKHTSTCEPRIGEIVHIKEDSPRGKWRMGKLEELIQSNDTEIRAAKVRMSNGNLLKRPLNLLYPMELAESTETEQPKDIEMDKEIEKECIQEEYPTRSKSKRVASKNAKAKIRLLAREENI